MIAWIRRLLDRHPASHGDEYERRLINETKRRQRAAELELKRIEADITGNRRTER